MEVSGQKHFKQTDVKLCSFCEDFDITTCADGFCVECEIFFCHKCFVKHKGRKISRDHSLVKVGESTNVKTTQTDSFDLCQQHNEEFIKYYCPTHDQVCCGECIVLHHNGCKLELVRDKAASFQKSNHLTDLSREIKKSIKQANDIASLVQCNSQLLTDLHEQFVHDIDTFVGEIIEHINTMKTVILDKGKGIMLKDTKRMDDLNLEIDELIAEISQQNEQLESKRDQPNKLFVASISIKTELKKSQQRLDLLKKKNSVTHYTFQRDQILENILKERKMIGVLLEQPEMAKQRHSDNEQTIKCKESHEQVLQAQQITLGIRSEFDKCEVLLEDTPVDSYNGPKQKLETDKKTTETLQTLDEDTMSVSQQKYQPLIQRQKLCKNINIDGQILSYAASLQNQVGIYVDNRPLVSLNLGDFFEIEILSIGSGSSIALGVVPNNYPDNLLPGVELGSIGYHSDGRVLISGYDKGGNGCVWKIGDRIRCEITVHKIFGNFAFSLTRNGREVGSFRFYGDHHFAVGMKTEGDKVKVLL